MVLVVPEQSQRPYRFGMTLLCVGALFNWLGLADTYSDPVPAIRYIGVGLIAAGASLICMAMCFWMRNIHDHDPNISSEYEASADPVHVVAVDTSLEKPPDYSSVVDVPPCYEEAIKLHTAIPVSVHTVTNVLSSNNQPVGTIDASSKSIGNGERNNSLQSSHSCDNPDIPAESNQDRCSEKSVPDIYQNSSQSGSTLASVLRKSIRGIRRLRSGSEDSNQSHGHLPSLENGTTERVCATPAVKPER